MAYVNASTAGSTTGSAWRNEQHSAVGDPALTDFPLQRYNALIANTLQVNHLENETVARTELLNATLGEMDVTEISDLLMIAQAITTVRANCEEQKNTVVSTEWMPTTLIPGSMSDGLFGLRYTIPTPQSPCNCFSLSALHARRTGNWRALKMAENRYLTAAMPTLSMTATRRQAWRLSKS